MDHDFIQWVEETRRLSDLRPFEQRSIMGKVATPRELLISLHNRLISKAYQDGECWVFNGQIMQNGYGRISYGGNDHVYAHRAAHMVFKGPVPDGLLVCHKCDNRRCINPNHLFVGTAQDNTNDMIAKGRDRHPSKLKLTTEIVNNIRIAKGTGRSIGKKFGVSQTQVWRIRKGLAYADTK